MTVGHRLHRLASDLDELAMRLELRARPLDAKESRRIARELRDMRRDLELASDAAAQTDVIPLADLVEPGEPEPG